MSQPITRPREITDLLNEYAKGFARDSADASLLDQVRALLPQASDANELRIIADRAWDEYFCVDVDLVIRILRRWLQIEPASKEAKRALGSYLLAHGPDWDDEGHRLLEEANAGLGG